MSARFVWYFIRSSSIISESTWIRELSPSITVLTSQQRLNSEILLAIEAVIFSYKEEGGGAVRARVPDPSVEPEPKSSDSEDEGAEKRLQTTVDNWNAAFTPRGTHIETFAPSPGQM